MKCTLKHHLILSILEVRLLRLWHYSAMLASKQSSKSYRKNKRKLDNSSLKTQAHGVFMVVRGNGTIVFCFVNTPGSEVKFCVPSANSPRLSRRDNLSFVVPKA